MITVDDLLLFCSRTLDGYESALGRLDDDTINQRPILAGGSSPFQLVTHALGAASWWTRHHVCGQAIDRDRHAEFEAAGTVDDAVQALAEFRHTLTALAPAMRSASVVHGNPSTQSLLGAEWTVGACLIHAYEELAQHLGHLEVTVDLVAV